MSIQQTVTIKGKEYRFTLIHDTDSYEEGEFVQRPKWSIPVYGDRKTGKVLTAVDWSRVPKFGRIQYVDAMSNEELENGTYLFIDRTTGEVGLDYDHIELEVTEFKKQMEKMPPSIVGNGFSTKKERNFTGGVNHDDFWFITHPIREEDAKKLADMREEPPYYQQELIDSVLEMYVYEILFNLSAMIQWESEHIEVDGSFVLGELDFSPMLVHGDYEYYVDEDMDWSANQKETTKHFLQQWETAEKIRDGRYSVYSVRFDGQIINDTVMRPKEEQSFVGGFVFKNWSQFAKDVEELIVALPEESILGHNIWVSIEKHYIDAGGEEQWENVYEDIKIGTAGTYIQALEYVLDKIPIYWESEREDLETLIKKLKKKETENETNE